MDSQLTIAHKSRTLSPNLIGAWIRGNIASPQLKDHSGNGNNFSEFSGSLNNLKNLTVWATATAYALGARREPTARNGLEYEVTAISGTGTSGAAEPVWPTTIGATVVDNAGANQITWTCRKHHVPGRACWSDVGVFARITSDTNAMDITAPGRSVVIPFFFNLSLAGGSGALLSKIDQNTAAASRSGWGVGFSSNALQINWTRNDNTIQAYTAGTFAVNADHHGVVVRDGVNNTISVYVDGAVTSINAASFNVKQNNSASPGPAELILGGAGTSASLAAGIQGLTGELFVWGMDLYYKDGALPANLVSDLIPWLMRHPYQSLSADQWS